MTKTSSKIRTNKHSHYHVLQMKQQTILHSESLIKRMSELLQKEPILMPPPFEHCRLKSTNEGQKPLRSRKKSDQQSFEPEYHQIKKLGMKVNKKRYSAGSWSSSENYIYYCFMRSNYNDFLTERERRKRKVFFRLSQILKRRTPDQCRSHHQKLQLKFNDDLPTIMNEVNKKIQKSLAEELVNNQYHYQMMQMERMSQMGGNSVSELKTVAQEAWYNIKSNELVTKIEINTDYIADW